MRVISHHFRIRKTDQELFEVDFDQFWLEKVWRVFKVEMQCRFENESKTKVGLFGEEKSGTNRQQVEYMPGKLMARSRNQQIPIIGLQG